MNQLGAHNGVGGAGVGGGVAGVGQGLRGSARRPRVVENEIGNLPAAKSIPQIRGVIGAGHHQLPGMHGRPALPLPVPLPAHIAHSEDERFVRQTARRI